MRVFSRSLSRAAFIVVVAVYANAECRQSNFSIRIFVVILRKRLTISIATLAVLWLNQNLWKFHRNTLFALIPFSANINK